MFWISFFFCILVLPFLYSNIHCAVKHVLFSLSKWMVDLLLENHLPSNYINCTY